VFVSNRFANFRSPLLGIWIGGGWYDKPGTSSSRGLL